MLNELFGNFNKNNPFVILSKKEYDGYMDNIQETSRNYIKTRNIFWIIISIWSVFLLTTILITKDWKYINAIAIYLILIVIWFIYRWYTMERIRYYLKDSKELKDFEKISEFTSSDIINLDNVALLTALHNFYKLRGGLSIESTYLKRIGTILLYLSGSFLIPFICEFILIYER